MATKKKLSKYEKLRKKQMDELQRIKGKGHMTHGTTSTGKFKF